VRARTGRPACGSTATDHAKILGFMKTVPLLLLLLAGCASAPSPTPAARPAAPPKPAPAPPDPLVDELNLSFERGDASPDGWHTGGSGYVVAPDPVASHAGKRGLRLSADKPSADAFGVATAKLPVEKARSKRVTLSGWIRTKDVTGWAGLWLRADGAPGEVLGFDNMQGSGPKGTTEWTHYEVSVDVPAETKAVVFGVLLVGTGEAWVDELGFAFETPTPGRPVAVTGLVLGPDGAPVQGALVAAVEGVRSKPSEVVETDASGRFTLTVPAGEYAFTATSPASVAAYWPSKKLSASDKIELHLGTSGFTVSGEVRAVGRLPAGYTVGFTRVSQVNGDIFVVRPDATGKFAIRLPEARGYSATVLSDGVTSDAPTITESRDQNVTLTTTVAGPPPDSVVGWLGQAAIKLAAADAGHGFDDMQAIAKMVAGARIVALGEATHGTREFFQLKHRMLEYLVEKQGFTLFAIEANLPEARKVNDYVLHGTGTAAEALAGLYFWTWDTEEVLALIEWMRAYNADGKHKQKVQFLGIDMQFTHVAWPNVVAYLQKVDPEYAKSLPESLKVFAEKTSTQAWAALPDDVRTSNRAALDAVVARLDANRKPYSKKSSLETWRFAREDARVVAQAARLFEASRGRGQASFNARDEAMAENVGWLLEHEAKGAKMVIWAHNGHIARGAEYPGMVVLGEHLSKTYAASYVNFGFVFGEGGFQAIDYTGKGKGLHEFVLGPPPESNVATPFLRAGCALCVVDLRQAPRGEVADWFAAPHPMRDTGAIFSDEDSMSGPARLAKRFDAVIFVAKTTRARPNPSGRRN
jgi:erythromycin esterase